MNKIRMSLVAAIAAAAATTVAVATTGANAGVLDNILSKPKLSVELRPRYEFVDQDNTKDNAKALTVRTAVNAQFGLLGVEGLGVQFQGMSVDHFGLVTDYNDLAGNGTKYSVVADPAQTRVTQANISYSKNDFVGIFGRKMVVLDNARFIGNVGWRQMPQTYDLAAVIYNGVDKLSLLGAYVDRVHTIKKDGQFDTGSVLLHATYKAMPELTVTAYDYMVENFADHIGIRTTGKINLHSVKLGYVAEYAVQNDPTITHSYTKNPVGNPNIKQDARYYKIGANGSMSSFTLGAAYEFLSDKGDGAMPFSTPLATLHAMNGWADLFLNTPAQGLTDLSVKLAYNAGEYGKLVGIYHNFGTDSNLVIGSGSFDDLGSEVDVAYKYKINKGLGLLLKGAWYTAGDNGFNKVDTTKYWLQLDYKFHASL